MKGEETLILFAVTVADTLKLTGVTSELQSFDRRHNVCFFFSTCCSVRAFTLLKQDNLGEATKMLKEGKNDSKAIAGFS